MKRNKRVAFAVFYKNLVPKIRKYKKIAFRMIEVVTGVEDDDYVAITILFPMGLNPLKSKSLYFYVFPQNK